MDTVREPGLEAAIRAAGGVSELARRIGVSQPSVSNWTRVPAARILPVEAATGVPRNALRPDLYARIAGEPGDIEAARSAEYALLAALLIRPPDRMLLKRIAELAGAKTPLGAAHAALAQAARAADAESIAREYFHLFIGIGRGQLLPYGSYYLTGFLNERPLARLRADLQALGVERSGEESEPEDHAAILCEVMSGLINGPFAASLEIQRQFFEKHLAPWLGRFFADLEAAEGANFYRAAAAVGRCFIEIEKEAFTLTV